MTMSFYFLYRFPVTGFATRRQFQCQRRHITSITPQLSLSSDANISPTKKKKWEFVATDNSGSLIKNILVCGDGDLSKGIK